MLKGLLIALALAAPVAAQQAVVAPADVTHWRSGLVELDRGWAAHDGDNMAWAQPKFNDDAWDTVNIEDMGVAQPGWHWYRRHVSVGSDNSDVNLLIEAGEGTYELYVNGQRIPGPAILSSLGINRPIEHVYELSNQQGDFDIALRTHIPPAYHLFELPFCISMTMGKPTAIEYERQSLESDRLYAVAPSVAINLLLVLAGIAVLALYTTQRTERDYLFLGLFLLIEGMLNGTWHLAQAGVVPASLNMLLADPTTYFTCILQIEFTFAFARRRVSRPWRIYECLVLLPILMALPMWLGHISLNFYNVVQTCFIFPTAFMPVLLFLWYRRGNREAGWLIFPSLLPTIILSLYDLGQTSAFLGWRRFDFLEQPIPFGPIPVQTSDAGNFLFLLAIGIVMFFRFTRVSREQARTAAELAAATEVQRRLVPEALPAVAGYRIETAYIPAQEVGGDFYQVLPQAGGSALVVVGDISGKGLKAAMTGTLAIGALRTLAGEGLGPAALLMRLNDEMVKSEDGGFITCLCARVSADGSVTLANAGHLAPYLNGDEVELESGLPLGIAAGVEHGEATVHMAPGDRMTLLSDGVLEARRASGELYGFDRTKAISRSTAAAIAAAAIDFGQEDDITVLTLEFLGRR